MPDFFTLDEVAPGVHAATAHSIAGPAVSNATIIDLGDKTLVVDTFMTIAAADELADAVRAVTGRKAFAVVTSHFHSDHVGGNVAFGDTTVISTARTLELMRADAPADRDAYAAQVDAMLAAALSAKEQAQGPDAVAAAEGLASLADAMASTRQRYRLVLPDVTFDGSITVGGDREARIVAAGRGHTESDVFVHLPDAATVVAGDLVWNGIHPKTDDGFPADWAAAVRSLHSLDPTTVIPGHGRTGGAETVRDMADYLDELVRLIDGTARGDLDAGRIEPPGVSADWQGVDRMRRGIAALASA